MHNLFITDYFDWAPTDSPKVRRFNQLLATLGRHPRMVSPANTGEFSNVEQRMNMFHLLTGVLSYGVPGAIVELGCFTGQCAALFQTVIAELDPRRELHVFDSFEDDQATGVASVLDELVRNFQRLDLRVPELHPGWFETTVPHELPGEIAFVHIDAGPGLSSEHLDATVSHCLQHVYPRMPDGAVGLLMDYCVPEMRASWNQNPAVRRAADRFFAQRPESVSILYAGDFSHGYFRKGRPQAQ